MSAADRSQPPVGPGPAGARRLAGPGMILLLVALLVGGAWRYTRQPIAVNEARSSLAEIASVLPGVRYDNDPWRDGLLLDTGNGERLPVYPAWRGNLPVAAVLTVVVRDGYVGPVRLLVGLAADGRVLAVRVVSQSETPGIGAAIADRGSALLAQFAGRGTDDPPVARWTVRADGGDFDAIAGATVSSRAVVGGVRRAVQYFPVHRPEIFAPPSNAQPNPPPDPP
jgi:electron transport complex protein RnfG